MSRMIAAALAAFVCLVVSLAVISTGTSHVGVSPALAASTKTCKSKMPNGKTKSWRCGTNQACCVNKDMGLYVCGIPGLGCL